MPYSTWEFNEAQKEARKQFFDLFKVMTEHINEARAAGYRAGQEEMRERARAATETSRLLGVSDDWDRGHNDALASAAEAIAALPIKP